MAEISPEIIDIGKIGNESISSKPSVNFGGGIELLMNDKRKDSRTNSPNPDIDLGDLNDL